MKKTMRFVPLLLVLTLLVQLLPAVSAAPAAQGLTILDGDYIVMGQFDDTPIIWQVIHQEGELMTLFCAQSLLKGPYDASDHCKQNSGFTVNHFGSVSWRTSDVRKLLNSAEKTVEYDTAAMFDYTRFGDGISTNFGLASNSKPAYADYGGFLQGFTVYERCLIETVDHQVISAITDDKSPNTNYQTDDYKSDFSGATEIYSQSGATTTFSDDLYLLNALEYYQYVVLGGMQAAMHNPYENDKLVQLPFWLSDSIYSENYGTWNYYGLMNLAVSETLTPTYGHYGALGVVPSTEDIIRPACQINASYILGVTGTGSYEDPYVLDIDQSVLARGAAKNLYKKHPDEWSFTVYKNKNLPDQTPDYVLAEDVLLDCGDGTEHRTDAHGHHSMPFTYQNVTVSLPGYRTRELRVDQLMAGQEVYLERESDDPAVLAVWVDEVDVLHTSLELDLSSTKSSPIDVEMDWGTAADPHRLVVREKGLSVALDEKGHGRLHWLSDDANPMFDPTGEITLSPENGTGKAIGPQKKLQFHVLSELPEQLSFLKSYTLGINNPSFELGTGGKFLGNLKLDFDLLSNLEVYQTIEDGKFYLVAGLHPEIEWGTGKALGLKSFRNTSAALIKKYDDAKKVFDELRKDGHKFGKGPAKWGFKAGVQVLVYLEGYLGADGKVVYTDQGGIYGLDASATKSVPFIFMGAPMSTNVKGSGEITAKVSRWKRPNDTRSTPDVTIDGNLTLAGDLDLGIKGVLSGGVGYKGILTTTMSFLNGSPSYSQVKLNTTPYFTADVLWGGVDFDLNFFQVKDAVIYQFPETRSPAGAQTPAVGPVRAAAELQSDYALTKLGSAGEEAVPQLAHLDNGRLLSVWVGGGSQPDQQRLTARYYDGETWSDPFAVDPEDTTADFQPCLQYTGSEAWLVWTDLDTSVDSLTLQQAAPHTRIRAARFDPDTLSFTVYPVSEADGSLQYQPVLCTLDSAPYVFWVQNDRADWSGLLGENRVLRAELGTDGAAPESWAVLPGPVRSIVGVGDKVFTEVDTDRNLMTVDDREIYCDGSPITQNDVCDRGLFKANSWVYWDHDGDLLLTRWDDVSSHDVDGVPSENHQLVLSQGSGRRVQLYLDAAPEGETGTVLYARYCMDDVWSEIPLALTKPGSCVVDYAADLGEDEVLEVDVLATSETGENPTVYHLRVDRPAELSLDDAWVDTATYMDGSEMTVHALVTNRGTQLTDTVKLELADQAGEIAASAYKRLAIQPGQSTELTLQLPVDTAADGTVMNLTVSMPGTQEPTPADNSLPLELSQKDVVLENLHWGKMENGKAVIQADIVNRGHTPVTGYTMTLRRDAPDGTVVERTGVLLPEPLETLQVNHFSFEVPYEEDACYYMEVGCSDDQPENNRDYVVLQQQAGWTYAPLEKDYDCHGDLTLCPGRSFTDMPPYGNWAHTPIDWAVTEGITNGTSPTTFSPAATCTRGQVVTFLWRAAGSPAPEQGDNPFKDVVAGAYYEKAVLWAVENGITNGMGPDTFAPDRGCTRGQVVTFLWRAAGSPEPEHPDNPFADVAESFYYKAVLWAVENGITNGTSPTQFSPAATCQRAQIVAFLYRDLVR